MRGMPFAKLGSEADARTSRSPCGCDYGYIGAVPQFGIGTRDGIYEGNVFQAIGFWQAAHLSVKRVGAGQASAEMVMMAGPGIMRVRIEQGLEPGDGAQVARVFGILPARGRWELGEITGMKCNSSANGVHAAGEEFEIARDPVAGDGSIAIGGEECARRGQTVGSFLHQHAPGGSYVGILLGQPALDQMQGEGGMLLLELACDLGRGIRAVIQEDDHFIEFVRKRLVQQGG